MTTPPPKLVTGLQDLEAQIADLKAANRHLRELAEAERRRADAAERSARTAWAVASRS